MAVAHPAPPLTADTERTGILDSAPSSPFIFAFLTLAVSTVVAMLYLLWKFWPTASVLASGTAATPVHFFWITKDVTADVRLFVVVALAGALGGVMHATRSFSWYVGHSALKWRWVPYYIGTLFIGAGLATIVYVVVRGGIVSGRATSADVNPYGFAAVGAIVGLFSEQALEMLRRVATDFFAEAPKGVDSAADASSSTTSTATEVPAVRAPAVQVIGADPVTSTTATLAGTVSPNGDATTYHFEWGVNADYGQSTADGELSGPDPVAVTVDLTDLTPATEYHFRLVAANSVDVVQGTDSTFTTAAA